MRASSGLTDAAVKICNYAKHGGEYAKGVNINFSEGMCA